MIPIVIFALVVVAVGFSTGLLRIKGRKVTTYVDPVTGETKYHSSVSDAESDFLKIIEDSPEVEAKKPTTLEEKARANADRVFAGFNQKFRDAMVSLELTARNHQIEISDESKRLDDEVFELYKGMKDLFNRIAENGDTGDYEITYAHKINKLSTLLGRRYYVKLVNEPEHANNPEERIASVRNALDSMLKQVTGDIKRVSEQGFGEFDVIIERLTEDDTLPEIEHIFNDKKDSKNKNA